MKRLWQFLKESRAELRKVSWPTWEDINRSTIVVLVTVIVATLFIFFSDKAISFVMQKVLG